MSIHAQLAVIIWLSSFTTCGMENALWCDMSVNQLGRRPQRKIRMVWMVALILKYVGNGPSSPQGLRKKGLQGEYE